jgi:excisionase family DNA binding protein
MPETKRKMKAEYLGVAEAESMTGVSRWTWRRWAYDGKIASVKLGKRLVIPASEIERLVAENTRPSLPVAR